MERKWRGNGEKMQFQITSNIDDGDDNHMDFSNDESFDDDVRYES
jgi:hypothetical protein